MAASTTRVTSSDFQKEYGRYSTLAKRQPVTITNHGRAELVILDAEEYERLQRLDTRVAMATDALTGAELDDLERSEIPEETKKLDVLVPKGWVSGS
jgi:PHD/YefM family antitoxin component YafN of YafNO toxin-antitoxin module